jgi:hypothetical protein
VVPPNLHTSPDPPVSPTGGENSSRSARCNAFTKKVENFDAAISLQMAYYNRCKVHAAIRAMEIASRTAL